jgi:putative PEP-CTERM system TPR-repeat lipoprotein
MTTATTQSLSTWPRRHLSKLLIGLLAAAALTGGAYLYNRPTPESQIAKAASLRQAGNMKAATIELMNAAQARPNSGEIRWLLGKAYFDTGRLIDAEKEFSKARDLGFRNDELVVLLAQSLLELGKPDRVLEEATPRSDMTPEIQTRLLVLRAQADHMNKDVSTAEDSLTKADQLVLDHPDTLFARAQFLFAQGAANDALVSLDKAMSKEGSNPKMWLFRGELLDNLNRRADSEQAYLKAAALEPWNIPARLALAQRYANNKQLAKAEAQLGELRKIQPNHPLVQYLDALVALRAGRTQEALTKLQPVLRALPDLLPARLLAGTACVTLGKREEAQTHLNAVLAVVPDHQVAQRLMAATLLQEGQLDQAKTVLESLPDAPNDSLGTYLRGNLALRQGDYADAKRQFEQVIQADPGAIGHYLELAASERGLGNTQGVITALSKAVALDKTYASDQRLISAYIQSKRYDEALEAVTGLSRKKAAPAMVHNARGLVLTARGDIRQARAAYEEALVADPTFMGAITNLANLDILDKNYKLATSRYEALLKKVPGNTNALIALAYLANLQNNIPAIREYLEKAKRTNPLDPEPRIMLIHYLLNQNKPDIALTEAKEALAATGNSGFRELIGSAYAAAGDHQSALSTFERWANDNPGSAAALTHLAKAQAAVGKRKEAMRTIDLALGTHADEFATQAYKMNMLVEDGKVADALLIARQLQQQKPQDAVGYVGEATVLELKKKYPEAAQFYVKGAQLANQGRLLTRAANAYVMGGNSGEAINVLNQWLRTNPGDLPVRHALAEQLAASGQHREAVAQYRSLVKAHPRDAVAYNNLALQLLELKSADAVQAAEQATKLNPADPMMQDTLGWVLVHNGQAKRGVTLIKKAFDAMPNALELHWHYAASLATMGEPVLARFELERLLNRGQPFPQEEEARKLFARLKS